MLLKILDLCSFRPYLDLYNIRKVKITSFQPSSWTQRRTTSALDLAFDESTVTTVGSNASAAAVVEDRYLLLVLAL